VYYAVHNAYVCKCAVQEPRESGARGDTQMLKGDTVRYSSAVLLAAMADNSAPTVPVFRS
jgi:hypothetical protein